MVTRDNNHIYRNKAGKIYISVTQQLVISGWSDFSMIDPDTLEYAGERGKFVHDALNLSFLDDLNLESIKGVPYEPYVLAGIKFIKENNIKIWDYNILVWNDNLRTAGEMDFIGTMGKNPRMVIFDWKTGVKTKTTPIQLAGYGHMNKKSSNPLLMEVDLKKTGSYSIDSYHYAAEKEAFKSICRGNWHALSRGIIPVGAKNNDNVYQLCKTIIREG